MVAATRELPTKERILSVCVKLFLERGYKKTTVSDITTQANVSNSSFQHFFRAKDGVLTELCRFMFNQQFDAASAAVGGKLPPSYAYVAGAAVQMALAEHNENLRELYQAAYVNAEPRDVIQRATAKRVHMLFGSYQPTLTQHDFLVLVLGTTGMMLGYMSHPCDDGFPLEEKVRSYLASELRVYRVPEEELAEMLDFVLALDIWGIAHQVMEESIRVLSTHYEFSLESVGEAMADW